MANLTTHVAQKYKEYTKLRNLLSATTSTQASSSPPAKKRKSFTPQKPAQQDSRLNHTPHPSALDPYDSPRSAHLTPTRYRTSIGPTPQRNGRVLGLFDLLSPTSASLTPSKPASADTKAIDPQATPSKPARDVGDTGDVISDEEVVGRSRKHSRTPQSSSRRIYLDSFLTPSARRINQQCTPGSRGKVSKLRFDETPEFLRRGSQRTMPPRTVDQASQYIEDGISWSPVAVRMPAKPAGQGLSALVKGLRQMQDEKLDEELDMLREMEAEEGGLAVPPRKLKAPPKIMVQDSQMDMPLGPDGESAESSEDEDLQKEGKGRDGKPLKVWKKKGQKRSTRKVNMKPSTAKWKPEAEWKGGEADSGDELAVTETQIASATVQDGEKGVNRIEDERSGGYSDASTEAKPEKHKESDLNGSVRGKMRPPKKIAATAHANFRALKIKNKQSKGKRGAKFGRKR